MLLTFIEVTSLLLTWKIVLFLFLFHRAYFMIALFYDNVSTYAASSSNKPKFYLMYDS